MSNEYRSLIIKQNILKNLTIVFTTVVLSLWTNSYVEGIAESAVDIFFLLSIFPLGAMFAYFSFSYSQTNLVSPEHRMLADLTTFIFLIIICFSVTFSTMIGISSFPQLQAPFILLAFLLIAGCLVYDFWNLYTNIDSVT